MIYGWVSCGVTFSPQAQLQRDGPLRGGAGDWKAVSEGHLGDQRASPACQQPCWPSKEEGRHAGAVPSVSDGPNRQGLEDPPPPKQGGWSVPGAPSTSSQGGQGVFLLTLRGSRVSLAQGRPRELESLSKHQPPPGKQLPGPRPLEERATSLKAKMSGPQGRPQNPHIPSRVTLPRTRVCHPWALPTPPPLINSTCPEEGVLLGAPGPPAAPRSDHPQLS